MFRHWTLGWLRDDLRAYAQLAEQNNPAVKQAIQQPLTHWLQDPNLASVRDPPALDRLADNERMAWQALWRDVDELLTRVAKKHYELKESLESHAELNAISGVAFAAAQPLNNRQFRQAFIWLASGAAWLVAPEATVAPDDWDTPRDPVWCRFLHPPPSSFSTGGGVPPLAQVGMTHCTPVRLGVGS
jgi:hypothetical protein